MAVLSIRLWGVRLFAISSLGLLSGCAASPAAVDSTLPSTGQAFDGVQCSAVRPQTEPDLMAWDSGSRANLRLLSQRGVVAVRYHAEGCNVELEVLSNCIAVGKASYSYAPYGAEDSKIVRNANELYAELPVGAAKLSGKLHGGRALRTDYRLVGIEALPPEAHYSQADLQGQDCARATHVVSKVYLGGFAMVAASSEQVAASAKVFGLGAAASSAQQMERLAREGLAEACEAAEKEGRENPQCAVPLRIGLLALEEPPSLPSPPAALTPQPQPTPTPTAYPQTYPQMAPPQVPYRSSPSSNQTRSNSKKQSSASQQDF